MLKEIAQFGWPTTDRIERTIHETPTELGLIYKRVIDHLKDINADDVLKLLLWIAYAKESLTLEDLEVAISLDQGRECRSIKEMKRYRVNLTSDLLIKRAGALVEVGYEVYFIHQSVKDYLIQSNIFQPLNVLQGEASPDPYISRMCVRYLNFEDWKDDNLESEDLSKPDLFSYTAERRFEHISSSCDLSDDMLPDIHSSISPQPRRTQAWLTRNTRLHVELAHFNFEKAECPQLHIAIVLRSTWMIDYVLQSGKFLINKSVLRKAVSRSAGEESTVFEMILYAWEKVNESLNKELIQDELIKEVAVMGTPTNMRLLLERHETYLITEDLLMTAANNECFSRGMFALLLKNL